MMEKKSKYDPAMYGQLRADFLKRLTGSSPFDNTYQSDEKRRQQLIKDIKEGKIVKQH
jgi:hypothetical protein